MLYIGKSIIDGFGAFAHRLIESGEVIEVPPIRRFPGFNFSHNPNVESPLARKLRTGSFDPIDGWIAMRDILPNEELTIAHSPYMNILCNCEVCREKC